MTSEQLHDAISLLPGDLIAEADKKRTAPRAVIRWQRYAAMAACFLLMIGGSAWCLSRLGMGGAKETAAEAPAAMQASMQGKVSLDEALPETQAAAEAAPAENTEANPGSRADEAGQSTSGTACYASSVPEVTLSVGGQTYPLTSDGRKTLADILSGLTYLPENLCECIAEIEVQVNGDTTFHINLEEGFVRCERGQAVLTKEQTNTLQQLIDGLAQTP